jgi:cytochrome c
VRCTLFLYLITLLIPLNADAAVVDGDPSRGKRAFLKCVMCHSVEPGSHKAGPSLARIWGSKAATVEGFGRYSMALKQAGVVWNADTLDVWLQDPKAMVPGTLMRTGGIESETERWDIIAYLKQLAVNAHAVKSGDVGADTRSTPELTDLTAAPLANQMISLSYGPDICEVTKPVGVIRIAEPGEMI